MHQSASQSKYGDIRKVLQTSFPTRRSLVKEDFFGSSFKEKQHIDEDLEARIIFNRLLA